MENSSTPTPTISRGETELYMRPTKGVTSIMINTRGIIAKPL